MRTKGNRVAVAIALATGLLLLRCSPGAEAQRGAGGSVRIATYNVEWFSEDANPARIEHLKNVVSQLNADVMAFQEIQSERALRQIVGDGWDVGMVDDPDDQQETAIAVRRPYVLVGAEPVFTGSQFESAFPGRRDALRCVVQSPAGQKLVLYVVHMKSRRGGRKETDPQRQAACGLLAAYISGHPDDENVAVLGDFNDTPDDASVEVLETGDLLAAGGSLKAPGRLLTNLMSTLHDQDTVSIGLTDLFQGGDMKPIVPGAKADNDRLRGQDYEFPRDVKVPQALFDQILVSPHLAKGAQAVVYARSDALIGEKGKTRVSGDSVEYTVKGDLASDHLPVYADLVLR